MTALIHFDLDDDATLGGDEGGIFAETRAMAEAARLDAAGRPAAEALAPIAALDDASDAYRRFVSTSDTFIYPDKIWRFQPATPAVIRLALQRAQAEARARDDESELITLATLYAAHGFEDEGRRLIRRARLQRQAIGFWIEVGDFAAAERAIRARGDPPNPMALFNAAGAAIEAGDNAFATRVALEVLDTMVRGHADEVIVVYNRVALAGIAARTLMLAGQDERAARYAQDLASAYAPDDALYGAHMLYALTMLRESDNESAVCALARQAVAHAEIIGAREIAVELARCGDAEAARALATRHGVGDFWLGYYSGDPLDANDMPYTGGMLRAIEADAAAGRHARAAELLHILFVRQPYLAAYMINNLENPEIAEAWRTRGVFGALRARLVTQGRDPSAALSGDDLDAVFAAAFTLLTPPSLSMH